MNGNTPMTRLDLLKQERETVKKLRCISFDAKRVALNHYDREIAAIEVYGSDNTEVEDRTYSLMESITVDAGKYQQVKELLADEGFLDLPTMIARYKQVMRDANDIEMSKDEQIESLTTQLATKTTLLDAAIAGQETLQSEITRQDEKIARLTEERDDARRRADAAVVPDGIEVAAEYMFQALCMAPQFTRELMDAVSAFWKEWAQWRGEAEGEKVQNG